MDLEQELLQAQASDPQHHVDKIELILKTLSDEQAQQWKKVLANPLIRHFVICNKLRELGYNITPEIVGAIRRRKWLQTNV